MSKCYRCTECPQGCLRKDVLVNAEDPGNVNSLDKNGGSEDDKRFASISPIQCCEASELPLPVCEDCKVCPDTGCNLLTGECCFSPEDVHGGCAPCLECDQCIANTTTCCPATKNCPMRKTVGGVDYTLSYTGQVLSGCLHDCVYHRDDDSSARFCFERGNQTVSYERGRNKLAINHTINNNRRWNAYQFYAGIWGTWGKSEFCQPGSFVFGYSLRSETGVGSDFDDTALNSVSLKCRSPGSSWTSQYLYSRTGYWGYWSSPRYCSGTDNPVVGFKVKFERSQGGGDDTAANDIDLYCQKDEIISAYVRSDWGSWSTWHRCPSGMAVTGLQTRVESQQGGDDNTALNGFLIYCDYYPGNMEYQLVVS